MALSDLEQAILDFERGWILETGSKDAAVRERLGLTPTAYYKLRRTVIDSDDALEYDPLLVRRLRRAEEHRRRVKFEGRTAGQPPR
ncbi:MAG TPA: DUF3263 domain-containing protein [Acidimicrobiales bacterium]|nr:DUF3263 domain-containing protein [Acidimicrobiales bacterium]